MFDTPIRHAATKVPGERGYASEWNADHIITSDLLPRRSATIIVAASDSLDKGRADYVCDGVADQVEIITAIDNLPAGGGKVVLLEGTYKINDTIGINKANVTIEGQGKNTKIKETGNVSPMIQAVGRDYTIIKMIALESIGEDVTGISFTNQNHCKIENVWSETTAECFYLYNCNYCTITLSEGNNATKGIQLWSCKYCILSMNYVKNNIDGIDIRGDSDNNIIESNICMNNEDTGILIAEATCNKNLVHGNICIGNGTDINNQGRDTTLADNVTT